MKATVWTKWNMDSYVHELQKPKCIFDGEIQRVPNIGEWVVVREGFAAHVVAEVINDFTNGSVEIKVDMVDGENAYGPSLI